ncbi:MAG: type I restriction-modification enzyme R subunit C-terminal domain-containing protein [Methanobacteriota archaeon]
MLISELAKLMKYMAPEPRKTIVLDMDDMIQQRKLIEFGPDAKQEYVKVYKEKVEDRIKRLADEHPATYIIENSRHYSADQLNFIRTVQTVFSKKKHIEYTELFDAPFTNFGINAPMPMFTENKLNDFINICSVLEKEIYAEA